MIADLRGHPNLLHYTMLNAPAAALNAPAAVLNAPAAALNAPAAALSAPADAHLRFEGPRKCVGIDRSCATIFHILITRCH